MWAHTALAGACPEQELLWLLEGLYADVIPVSDLEKRDTQEFSDQFPPHPPLHTASGVRGNLAKHQSFSWFQMIKAPAAQLHLKKMSNGEKWPRFAQSRWILPSYSIQHLIYTKPF